jgi:hypothetical protein
MNNPPLAQQTHLTEDQLDDHLIGDLAAAPAAHLTACPYCTARVADAAGPLANFREVSLAWGERKSATSPIPSPSSATGSWERRFSYALAGAAIAAGLGMLSSAHRTESTPASQPAYSEQATTPTADQLSDDNRLLNTIDQEVSSSSENSATLGLLPVSTPRPADTSATSIRTSIQD